MSNLQNDVDRLIRQWYNSRKVREYEQDHARNNYEKEIYYNCRNNGTNENDCEYKILWLFANGDFCKAKQELPIYLEKYEKAMRRYEKLLERVSDLERILSAYGDYYFDFNDRCTIEQKLLKKRNEVRYQGILIDTIKQDMIDRFKKITDDGIMISRDTNVQL